VTRVTEGTNDYFYYGKYDLGSLPESYIASSYQGFDGGMGGYLIFGSNRVELIRLYGIFKKVGPDQRITLKEMDNMEFLKWKDSLGANYDRVSFLYSAVNVEKRTNQNNRTKVNIKYENTDDHSR
jgi:hypothetical protein